MGSITYSWGVGIKMSLLLALPGIIMVLGQGLPVNRALRNTAIMAQFQVCELTGSRSYILGTYS